MAATQPQLSFQAAPESPGAVVLVLHGGRESSHELTSPYQLSVLRMVPLARRIARSGHDQLAVARLRFAVRGWNGALQSPVADTCAALQELHARYPSVPIGLVGHSMGGRTALRCAGHPAVTAVVGLAPWLPPDEPIAQLSGRRVLLVHGSADRMTSARGSSAFAARLRGAGVRAGYVEIAGGTHAMLRRPRLWHDLAAGFLEQALLGQSASGRATNLLQQIEDGNPTIAV